jgi:hypothetical protein
VKLNNLKTRLRRVITALDSEGRSFASIDGPPGEILEWREDEGLYEIWTDPGQALARRDRADLSAGPVQLSPPFGGMKVRWFSVAPSRAGDESDEDLASGAASAFAQIGAAQDQPDTSRHPAMHLTSTIDVIVVVSGRVRLLLDADERVLGPGDVVLQRGTNHAWVCEGDEPAVMVAVLSDRVLA